ncbi:MAG: hypothetical protein Q9212_002910 [Teloschistes hypoglaucus]
MASNGNYNEKHPEDVDSSEPEDHALFESSEQAINEKSPRYPLASWILKSLVTPLHPLYTAADTAVQYIQRTAAVLLHTQLPHNRNLLESALQDHRSQFSRPARVHPLKSALENHRSRFSNPARVHLSPLNIKTYVASMPPRAATTSAPGAARGQQATRGRPRGRPPGRGRGRGNGRGRGAPVLNAGPSTHPINHLSNAPEGNYVADTTFPSAAQSTRVNPGFAPAFPPPSTGHAARPVFQGPLPAPFVWAQPAPGTFFRPGPAYQQFAQFYNRSSAPHHGDITLPPPPQLQGVPLGQLLPWYNPPANRTRGAPATRQARIHHSAHPDSPLNRFGVDIPNGLNAALSVPFFPAVRRNFGSAPAHLLDCDEAFRQINTYRNLGLGCGEIAEKLKAVGAPAATTGDDVKALWERRVAAVAAFV